jgi:hypothetical protein
MSSVTSGVWQTKSRQIAKVTMGADDDTAEIVGFVG